MQRHICFTSVCFALLVDEESPFQKWDILKVLSLFCCFVGGFFGGQCKKNRSEKEVVLPAQRVRPEIEVDHTQEGKQHNAICVRVMCTVLQMKLRCVCEWNIRGMMNSVDSPSRNVFAKKSHVFLCAKTFKHLNSHKHVLLLAHCDQVLIRCQVWRTNQQLELSCLGNKMECPNVQLVYGFPSAALLQRSLSGQCSVAEANVRDFDCERCPPHSSLAQISFSLKESCIFVILQQRSHTPYWLVSLPHCLPLVSVQRSLHLSHCCRCFLGRSPSSGGNTQDQAGTSRRAGQPDQHLIHVIFRLNPDWAHRVSGQHWPRKNQMLRIFHPSENILGYGKKPNAWNVPPERENTPAYEQKTCWTVISVFSNFAPKSECTLGTLGPSHWHASLIGIQPEVLVFVLVCWAGPQSGFTACCRPDQMWASPLIVVMHVRNISAWFRPELARRWDVLQLDQMCFRPSGSNSHSLDVVQFVFHLCTVTIRLQHLSRELWSICHTL